MEKREITINNNVHRLTAYPKLTGDRKILSIERQSPSYMEEEKEDATEDWVIYLSVRYQNEFDRY